MAKYSYSDAKKRASEHERDFDSFSLKLPKDAKLFKVKKAGIVRLDIIPFVAGKGNPFAEEGMLHYERTYYAHSRIGPNEVSVVCPKDTADEDGKTGACPVCELQRKLKLDPDADEKLVKSLYPRERQLFQVIDLDDEKAGIQLWDVSYHLFGKFLDARIRDADPEDGYHRFYRLDKGLTLKIGFKEESFGKHKFYKAETIDFKDRRESYDDSIIDKGFCLDELIKILSYDQIKEALEGGNQRDEKKGRDEDDEKPSRRSSDEDDEKPARRSRDDDDDDRKPSKKDEDDERPSRRSRDDDDDEKPANSSRKDEDDEKPARRRNDDDDDDRKPAKDAGKKSGWRDEDEDEDEKPSKSSRKADDEDDEKPARRSRDEDDEKPARRSRDDDDDRKPSKKDEDDEKPSRRSRNDDDDEKPSKSESSKKPSKDDDWD